MKTLGGKTSDNIFAPNYAVDGIGELLEAAQPLLGRTVNARMTARIGRSVGVSSSLNKEGRKQAGIRPGLLGRNGDEPY
jgi:hypothetical protein